MCQALFGALEMAPKEITISAVSRLVFQLREMDSKYKQVNDTGGD